MVLKDVSYLKRGNYVYIYGHWLNMELSQEFDTPYKGGKTKCVNIIIG